MLIKNRLEILLIELMRRLTETQDGNRIFLPDADFSNRLVRDTIAVMNEHIGDALTIADICRLTHYGRAHLFEQFKAYLEKNHIKQNAFFLDCIQRALADEAE